MTLRLGKSFGFKTNTNRISAGDEAGWVNSQGYVMTLIKRKYYRLHHIAWALHFGEWPKQFMDHKNGIGTDNRIENLRECTLSQNAANSRLRSNNTSGFKGVSYMRKNKNWVATINVKPKIFIGAFQTKEEAAEAYAAAVKKRYGEFANPARRGVSVA